MGPCGVCDGHKCSLDKAVCIEHRQIFSGENTLTSLGEECTAGGDI